MRRSLSVAALVLVGAAAVMGQELLPTVQRKPASQLPSRPPADCDDTAVSPAAVVALRPVVTAAPVTNVDRPRKPSPSTAMLLSNLQQAAGGRSYESFAAALDAVRAALQDLPASERANIQRVLPIYEDLQELWSYAQANAIGAFYDDASLPGMHAHLVSRYRGYAAYIDDFQITSDGGRKFYPTEETRKFLVREAARGAGVKGPAPMTASTPARPSSGGAPTRVATKHVTSAAPKTAIKPPASQPSLSTTPHTARPPKATAPRIAAATAPKKVEPAPAVAAPRKVASAPAKPAAKPVAPPVTASATPKRPEPAPPVKAPAKLASAPAPKPVPPATASATPKKPEPVPALVSPPPAVATAPPAASSTIATATVPPAAAATTSTTAPAPVTTAPATASAEPPPTTTSAPPAPPPVSTQTAVSAVPPQQSSSRLIFFVILGLISLGALVAMIRATRETPASPAPPEAKSAPPLANDSQQQKVYPLQSGTRKKK
jgi:hypothetical protein